MIDGRPKVGRAITQVRTQREIDSFEHEVRFPVSSFQFPVSSEIRAFGVSRLRLAVRPASTPSFREGKNIPDSRKETSSRSPALSPAGREPALTEPEERSDEGESNGDLACAVELRS